MRARLAIAMLYFCVTAPCAAQDMSSSEVAGPSTPSPSTSTPPSPSTAASPSPSPPPEEAVPLYLVTSLGGDGTEAMAAEACDAVRATLAAEGFGVVDPADAATIAPSRFADARRLDDLRPIATELGATAIATVAVWTSDGAASSVIVSIAPGERSFSATQEVSTSLGESARDALRAALDRQRDAVLVGGGTTRRHETEVAAPPPEHHDDGIMQNGQLFGIVGPGLLAAVGAAGIGAGVYASLDETCDLRNPMNGVCLRGERPNYALGVVFIAAGTLALAGAIVWWIVGATAEGEASSGPRIDVVLLPDGAYVGTRGTF